MSWAKTVERQQSALSQIDFYTMTGFQRVFRAVPGNLESLQKGFSHSILLSMLSCKLVELPNKAFWFHFLTQ